MTFGLNELGPDVEAAVDALVAAGLAAREGDSVGPTAAALRSTRCDRCGHDSLTRSFVGRAGGHGPASGLAIMLEAHPGQRSIEEVIREMTDRPDDFPARDAVENAIRDLVGAEPLHLHGAFVFATHAAVRFDDLRI